MRHIIETATDAANVCFFDPQALPRDFDEQAKEDTVTTFERMEKEGRLWWKNVEGDGGYLFHFYVEEDLPESLKKYALDPEQMERLAAPTGTIWACGGEYAAVDPAGRLKRFSHMGGNFMIQPGEYSVTAWRTQWPEAMLTNALRSRIGDVKVRIYSQLAPIMAIFFITSIFALVIVFRMTIKWTHGLIYYWAGAISIWLITWLLIRVLTRWEKNPVKREVEREYPSIVVQLRRIPAI